MSPGRLVDLIALVCVCCTLLHLPVVCEVTQTRHIPFVQITLSKEALDTNDKGYQA